MKPKRYKIVLPPNKTYSHPKCRTGEFIRYTKPAFRMIGVLHLKERKHPKKGQVVERTYIITQRRSPSNEFEVSKPMSFNQDETYIVTLTPKYDLCTCKAARRLGHCTHKQAVRALAGLRACSRPTQPPILAAHGSV